MSHSQTPAAASLTEQALHAAEQNMTDVIQLWASGRTSDLVFGEAIRDMKNDGLKLVKAARKADPSARIAELEKELALAYKGASEFAETAAKYEQAYGPLG